MDPMQNQNPAPAQASMPSSEPKKSFGPLAGVIIIVILLILGALYMFRGNEVTEDAAVQTTESSDEVSSIESDLQADGGAEIDLSELDSN
jgi:hypothetical protein